MNSTETLSEVQTFSFDIPSERLGEVQARIDALNRKCAKLDIAPITIEHGQEIVKKVGTWHAADAFEAEHTTYEDVLFTPVTITFHPVKVVGSFKFVAEIEHDVIGDENHNVISGYNLSEEAEKSYRHLASNCQHCGHIRRRNKTFIVRNIETNADVQVGSTCIADFFPMNVESAILSLDIAGEIASMGDEESFGGGGRGVRMSSVKNTVEMTVAMINKFGFVSSSKAKEESEFGNFTTSTATLVLMQLFPHPKMKEEDKVVPTENDIAQAAEIVNGWKENLVPHLNDDTLDQFAYKIACCVVLDFVKPKLHNTVVGSVGYSLRKLQEQKAPKTAVLNEYLPNVKEKDKVSLQLTVSRINAIQGNYGTTTIVNFLDAAGHALTWFASGELASDFLEVGKTYTIKATVKGFSDNAKYGKSTLITRAKKLD